MNTQQRGTHTTHATPSTIHLQAHSFAVEIDPDSAKMDMVPMSKALDSIDAASKEATMSTYDLATGYGWPSTLLPLPSAPLDANARADWTCAHVCGMERTTGVGTLARKHESEEEKEERLKRMSDAVRTLLECCGEDPTREGLLKTPERYAKALLFFTKGYEESIPGKRRSDEARPAEP